MTGRPVLPLTALAVALAGLLLAADLLAPPPPPGQAPDSPTDARVAADGCDYLDPEGRDLRLLFVGDSMTQGRTGSTTYRYWVWRGLHAQRSDVRFVGPRSDLNGPGPEAGGSDAAVTYERTDSGFGAQLAHAGQAGATFASSERMFPPAELAREQRPDVVVLQLGYNDSNRVRTTPAELAQRFTDYMESVWAVAPATRFVLGEIPPVEVSGRWAARAQRRNDLTAGANALVRQRWADDPCRVQLNDLRSSLTPAWDSRAHTYDGAHPGPAGETLMADRMLSALERLGVVRRTVSVYDPDARWDPDPVITVGDLGDGRVRVDWADEMDRLSATALQLRIGSDDDYRETAWFTSGSVALDLDPGVARIRAVVDRGLPGRMVSEPGEAREILVP